ncbi:peroxidase 60 [Herrania umbratica]|uniref:Peroxidase n=1 Tax=Herrania umbratica TaxID=108875 RepID=A0A6J0ZWE6_9ROSI|nr:peroxidase 60 [Herrania umbratica]
MNMRMSAVAALALALGLILVNFTGKCHAALQVGYYKDKCMLKDVEGIVFSAVKGRFDKDPTIAAALIRLHFHDCFVNGCDASILLDGKSSEKTAPPNRSVRGYDVIDEAKGEVEKACKGVVSCADIIAMAARDAVALSGEGRYSVETGRRDGFVSLASNVDLPSPSFSVSQSVDAFAKKGLDPTDMVLLLGGHTVGVAHCSHFQDRLYNFQNSGEPDPTMDLSLLQKLKSICPQNSPADRSVDLDQNPLSSLTVDNSFYKQIILKRGILQIDQELALDPLTNGTVASIATSNDFPAKFGQAMVKLGAVGVLTGSQGEIRKSCSVTNSFPNFLHF